MDDFAALLSFWNGSMNKNHCMKLLEIQCESANLVRDDLAALFKMYPKCEDVVTLSKAKQVLQIIEELGTLLSSSKAAYFQKIHQLPELMGKFNHDQLEKSLKAIDTSLNMSPIASEVLNSSHDSISDALLLIKSGLLSVHISGERSKIDISDQMLIEMEIKSKLATQFKNDLLAFDSCQLLFPVQADQDSCQPVQMQRRSLCQSLTLEVDKLTQQRPIRSEEESYHDLLSQMNQMKNGPLSLKTVQDLISNLQSMQISGLEKCENWFRTITPFIFSIVNQFKSFQVS